MAEHRFEGHTVEKIYESYHGDYWGITDTNSAHPFGYACLSGMPQFAEWGTINKRDLGRGQVWEVLGENWTLAVSKMIDIELVEVDNT